MAGDPAILFVKPKAISQRDKKLLRDAGVIVVEIDNPSDVKFTRAGTEISGSAMLLAAAKAIPQSDFCKKAFAEAMCEAINLELSK
jgi:hypothetical protein